MSRNRLIALLATAVLAAACSRKAPPPPEPAPGDLSVVKTSPTAGSSAVGSAAAAAAGSAGSAAGAAPAGAQPKYREPGKTSELDRSVLGAGKTFMVVSEAEPATAVGKQVLASGGNAVDAAVATAFALAVVHPTAGNIGGGGFAVVRFEPGKGAALDFRETAPAAATEKMFLDADGKPTDRSLVGHLASGVPGAVAGLWELHKKYGKKPWKDLVTPAVALARDGFVIDKFLAKAIAFPLNAERLKRSPASAALWLAPRSPDAKVTIPELAATLQRIADRGPDGFYKGETADAIVAEMKSGGGIITAADLAGYKPIWRDPLRFKYRGHTIASMPLPSSGGIVMAMTAGVLRKTDLKTVPWHGAEHVHWLAETWRRAFTVRNELLGDPAFGKAPPLQTLLSEAYLDKLAATISPDKATPSKDVPPLLEGNHTTNLCVVDGRGMAVALTTTINTSFGSAVTVTGGGFLLNNEMDDFTAKPGEPNTFGLVQGTRNKIEPGKRMLSSMSPSIVEDEKGNLVMLAGAGGGPRIITAVWQTISNVVDYNLSAGAAVASPRVHHQHLPDLLRVEAEALDRETDQALAAKGHKLDWGEDRRAFGAVNAIVRAKSGWEGSADPRGGGAAQGD
ncbi:MAG TPA: gamma-glutamyltransferase [Kofleriaceae bacterium]|nr:gamma-glutamyltransferase [Kofleriaceae bacterium]